MTQGATAEVAQEPGMSLAQWATLPEDEEGELVDGQLVEEEAPDAIHEDVAIRNGPFRAWMALCERGLASRTDLGERSTMLWTLANVALSSGAMDRAMIAAQAKGEIDQTRGDARGAAFAASCRANVLQARGEVEEALRIRRKEQLPVYEKLGAVRDLLVCRVKIALNLLRRGQSGDREAARDLLVLAYGAAEALRIPEAATIRRIQERHGLLPTT